MLANAGPSSTTNPLHFRMRRNFRNGAGGREECACQARSNSKSQHSTPGGPSLSLLAAMDAGGSAIPTSTATVGATLDAARSTASTRALSSTRRASTIPWTTLPTSILARTNFDPEAARFHRRHAREGHLSYVPLFSCIALTLGKESRRWTGLVKSIVVRPRPGRLINHHSPPRCDPSHLATSPSRLLSSRMELRSRTFERVTSLHQAYDRLLQPTLQRAGRPASSRPARIARASLPRDREPGRSGSLVHPPSPFSLNHSLPPPR